jgi:hypothetical protein
MVGKGHAEQRRYGVWMFFWTTVVLDERGTGRSQIGCSPFQNGKVLPTLRFHIPQRCGRPMSKPKPTFYSLATKTQLNPNRTVAPAISRPNPHDAAWGITRNLQTASQSIPPIFESAPHPFRIYTPRLWKPKSTRHLKPKVPFSLSNSRANSIIPHVKHTQFPNAYVPTPAPITETKRLLWPSGGNM